VLTFLSALSCLNSVKAIVKALSYQGDTAIRQLFVKSFGNLPGGHLQLLVSDTNVYFVTYELLIADFSSV
jgi:hypothetical protein